MLAGVHDPGTSDSPRMPAARLTRRSLLGGGALVSVGLVAAACTSSLDPEASSASGSGPAPGPDADADAPVRTSVAASEATLIALYAAVITAHPDLAGDLTALRDEHAAHAEAMGITGSASAPPPVGSRAQALAALREAEERAVAERTASCEECRTPDLARLTALIAASEAGHVEFLRSLT